MISRKVQPSEPDQGEALDLAMDDSADTSNGHNMVSEGGPVGIVVQDEEAAVTVAIPAPEGAFVPDSGLNDTGHRVNFSTGAHREIAPGKGRYDLISPFAMRQLAKLLEKGAKKYTKYNADGTVKERGERNWEKGLPLSTFVDSASRHLGQLLEGDDTEDHAAAAFWNMMAYMHTRHEIRAGRLPAELDDMPHGSGMEL